jgi:uncharacterized protein
MYFDIYKNKSGLYWWVAKGGNHETLCHSELYRTKQATKNTIKVVKQGAASASVYDETGEVKGDIAAKRIAV